MKRICGLSAVILAVGVAAAVPGAQAPASAPATPAAGRQGAPAGPGLSLTTTAFPDGGVIPDKYTQLVPNAVSPQLDWANVPSGVVSFALILHDPDTAPQRNSEDILHWMIINIPGTARSLPEGVPVMAQLQDGSVQPKSFRGANGYMGPGAAAPGPYHHYTFELFALDIKLDLTADAARADVLKAMNGHVLAKAAMHGRFHR